MGGHSYATAIGIKMPAMIGTYDGITIPDPTQGQPAAAMGATIQPGMYLPVTAPDENILFQ
jgi:hypothetical protein